MTTPSFATLVYLAVMSNYPKWDFVAPAKSEHPQSHNYNPPFVSIHGCPSFELVKNSRYGKNWTGASSTKVDMASLVQDPEFVRAQEVFKHVFNKREEIKSALEDAKPSEPKPAYRINYRVSVPSCKIEKDDDHKIVQQKKRFRLH